MEQHDTSVRDILQVVFKRKGLFVFVVAFSLLLTYACVSFITPKYKSEVRLLVSGIPQVESPYYTAISPMRTVDIAATISEVIKSRDLLTSVVKDLKLAERTDAENFSPVFKKGVVHMYRTYLKRYVSAMRDWFSELRDKWAEKAPWLRRSADEGDAGYKKMARAVDQLAKDVKVDSIERTDVIKLVAYDYNPVIAAKIADTLTKRYIVFNMERQLADFRVKYGEKYPSVRQLEEELKEVKEKLAANAMGFDEILSRGNVKIIEQASVPVKPVKPDRKVAYIVSALLSVLFGIVVMFIAESLDHSVRSASDVEKHFGLHVIASIPRDTSLRRSSKRKAGADVPRHSAYEIFIGRLRLLLKNSRSTSISVTSVERGEGKSTVAMDIALLLSQKNHTKTLLIDANFKSPKVNTLFGVAAAPGLSEVVRGTASLADVATKVNDNLYVVPLGKAGSDFAKFFKEEVMHSIIADAKKEYEVIIFDTPSLKSSAGSFLLSKQCDSSMLVIKEGFARREVIKDALYKMEKDRIAFLGVVFNDDRHFIPGFIYKHV